MGMPTQGAKLGINGLGKNEALEKFSPPWLGEEEKFGNLIP